MVAVHRVELSDALRYGEWEYEVAVFLLRWFVSLSESVLLQVLVVAVVGAVATLEVCHGEEGVVIMCHLVEAFCA